jgi:hypothetical protein
MKYQKILQFCIDTLHSVWISLFTGGIISIIIENKGNIGLILTFWSFCMLIFTGFLKLHMENKL